MKILITGRGYIGSSLGKCLGTCYETIVISKHEIDYTNRDILKRYIKRNDIGLVINTCGYTGRPNVDACESDKSNTWHYNVKVPVNMQKVCKDLVIPMIHISSGCIYTGYDKEFTEWLIEKSASNKEAQADSVINVIMNKMPETDIVKPLKKADD